MNKKSRAGVVIQNQQNEVLVLRRIKNGTQYFVFPGGGVEEGETFEQAAIREAQEELTLSVTLGREIARFVNEGRDEVYYYVDTYTGEPTLGGPEKEYMNENNQFYLEWKNLESFVALQPFYPVHMYDAAVQLLKNSKGA